MYWNDGQNQLHIELSRVNNVASFLLAHGFKQFEAFCCEAALDDPTDDPIAMPSTIISDDEDDHDEVKAKASLPWQSTWQPATRLQQENSIATEIKFALNGLSTTSPGGRTSTNSKESSNANAPNVIIDEEVRQPQSEMAKQGILPKRLAQCNLPTCSACLYAKATRKPWRGKTAKDRLDDKVASKPGQVVSIDQLVSPTPGLIAQMIGFLTTKRYK